MEPVILIVAVTAILSGTYIRSKKIALEKERIRLLAAGQGLSEEPSQKRGKLFGKAKQALHNLPIKSKQDNEIKELKERLANIETIVVDGIDSGLVNGSAHQVHQEIRDISRRLDQLDG